MKLVTRLIALVLLTSILLSLCACGNSGGATLPDGSRAVKGADFHYTLDDGCKETFNLRFVVTDQYDRSVGSSGIYMIDMDSGKMYDDTFLDWDLMLKDGDWNLNTRESAMMVFFTTYIDNMDSGWIWSSQATVTQLSAKELKNLTGNFAEAPGNVVAEPELPAEIEEGANQEPESMTVDFSLDENQVYDYALQLGVQLEQVVSYKGASDSGYTETMNLLLFKNAELAANEQQLNVGSAWCMLDLDTGIWYDDSLSDSFPVNSREYHTLIVLNAFISNPVSTFMQENSGIWSVHDEIQVLDETKLENINQKILLERLTSQKAVYPYASVDEESRKLSDEQLCNLMGRPVEIVKSSISTVPDAIAYMDMHYPELWHGASMIDGNDIYSRHLRAAQEVLYYRADNIASRSCIVNCLTYLLDDDYEIESLIAFWPDPNKFDDSNPQKAINVIKTASGYLFFDPVLQMQGDAMSRYGDVLPQMRCGSIAEYIENIRQNPNLSAAIKYIFKNTGGVRMDYRETYDSGYTVETSSPGLEVVYYSKPAQEAGEHIKPENIMNYMISGMLGGVTLTAEEAYALVDAEPEMVQEKVKTAADVLMYMLAARTADSHGCKCTDVGKYTWHWNMSAKEVMEKKLGNCGSCANLANYLLDGDYEEVGYMDQAYFPGEGGSHVYTYIRHQGKYYIVDYSWYIFNSYEVTRDYMPSVLDSLEQWPEKAPQVYGNLNLIMTYDTPGMQYPVVFGEQYQADFGDETYYILPEGVEYKILYDAGEGYQFHHIPFDKSAYDWDVFW